MVLIHHNPGITPRVLTQVTRRDKSTITPIVSELEHKGLIMRMRSNADRRSFGLSTTAKGAEVVDELDRIIRYHEKRIEELIGAEGRQELLKQVKLLAARL